MSTHRSLNKLEFKAHMSIHNKVSVPDEETHESNYTRDRFGKQHRISDPNGSSRLRRNKKKLAVLVLLPAAQLLWSFGPAAAQPGRHTNIQVESSALDDRMLDDRLNAPREDTPVFYKEGSTSVGFNEDGDPNMSMKF